MREIELSLGFNPYSTRTQRGPITYEYFQAMGLLDELKGIVIDQQRAIRERDAKIGTLQQQYDTLNASYWTVLQRLRSYDHIFR